MAKLEYKILKNMPSYNSYGQYYYNEDDTTDWLEGSGAITVFKSDDLYTIMIEEDFQSGGDDTMPDWRPISNVLIGNPLNLDNPNNAWLQKYYEFGSNEYLKTSAPNIVHLTFDLVENDKSFDLNYIDNPYAGGGGNIGARILNWDWKEGDYDYPSDFITNTNTANYFDLYDGDTSNYISHQYNSSGLKTIKVVVFALEDNGWIRYKYLDVKLFLGLDDIYVEDFIDMAGPDFTYLPWPETSPIIGGISKDSKYYKSVKSIVQSNNFTESENLEKYFAEKAYNNDQLGDSVGDTDVEQVRAFKGGALDMNYFTGVYNQLTTDGSDFFPYNNYDYWDGETKSFDETSIGTLFIDESLDPLLRDDCLFEFNCGTINYTHLYDSSGNGNKAILIGDYKITKDEKGIKAIRESIIKIPKIDTKNGAI